VGGVWAESSGRTVDEESIDDEFTRVGFHELQQRDVQLCICTMLISAGWKLRNCQLAGKQRHRALLINVSVCPRAPAIILPDVRSLLVAAIKQ
jgi:hypothetical protein